MRGKELMREKFMRLAIEKAREGIRKDQTPFGACVVKDGRVISCEHNVVRKQSDSTAHAEMMAIRKAHSKLRTIDLSTCEIYSTCEPCPMCFSACHWAKISKITYGATLKDSKKCGFNEFEISSEQMKRSGRSKIKIEAGVMSKECKDLLEEWKQRKARAKTSEMCASLVHGGGGSCFVDC